MASFVPKDVESSRVECSHNMATEMLLAKVPCAHRNAFATNNVPIWYAQLWTWGEEGFPRNTEVLVWIAHHPTGLTAELACVLGQLVSYDPESERDTVLWAALREAMEAEKEELRL